MHDIQIQGKTWKQTMKGSMKLYKTGSLLQLDAEILKHRCCHGIVFGDVGQISRPTRVGT